MVVFVGLGGCASQPASDEGEAQPIQTAQSEQKDQDDGARLICTREIVAGSHMSRRVCRTRREIEMERQEREQVLDQDNTLQQRVGE